MQLIKSGNLPAHTDLELIEKHLPLNDAVLLELGCGSAFTTRRIAENYPVKALIALEVDRIQHDKNLLITDLPAVNFKLAGMQEIPEPDNSIDAVIMLKSLHHVPGEMLLQGFKEVHRVLKPGGLLYISEPVFAGRFNDILRLFNDEETVRQEAFNAIGQAVNSRLFSLVTEIHFVSQSRFEKGFEDFNQRILGATHSTFDIDEQLFNQIKSRFAEHINADGSAVFNNPMRVNILQK